MFRPSSRLLALALAALAAGCGDLSHSNPFDPLTPEASQARASLSGTVALERSGAGAPGAAGVAVTVTGSKATRTAVTDAAGAWTASDVPPGSYTVRADKGGYLEGFVSGVTVTIDDGGSTLEVPTIRLALVRGDVSGRVALLLPDLTEEQTGGAAVSLLGLPGSTLTGSDGRFALSAVPAGTYLVEASKVGYLPDSVAATVSDAGVFSIGTLSLDTNPGWLTGTVQVVGGAVGANQALVRARGTTLGGTPWESSAHPLQADGSYLVSNLPAGTYSVTFELAAYGTVSTAAAVAPGAESPLPPVDLIRDTGSVIGVALLEGSGDHAGIQVSLTPFPKVAGAQPVAAALTDATGNWRVDLLPVGTYAIDYVRTPGYAPGTGVVEVPAKAAVTALPVTLVAIPGVIRGRAFFEGGSPGALDGTTVRIEGSPLSTATVASGGWTLPGVGAGTHVVVFERTGFDTQRAQVVTAPGGDVTLFDVTLAASRGDVTGVVDAAATSGDAGTVVTVSGGLDTATTITGATGRWRVDGLRVGTGYTATYLRAGYATATSASFAIATGVLRDLGTAALAVATSATVGGVAHVQRPAGADGGIAVTLTGTDLNGNPVGQGTTTLATGAWSIGSLPQGTYQVSLSKAAYDTQVISGIAVVAGGSATASTVTLPVSTGTVAGQASLGKGTAAAFAQGTDFSGIVVTLTGLDAGVSVASAVTDAGGSFRFDGVPVSTAGGAYGVVAQRSGYSNAAGSVTALSSATATVAPSPLGLTVDVGSLAGNLAVNDGGAPAAPASGTVTVSLTGTAFNATALSASATNVGAAFLLPNLPAGTYDLVATSAGRSCPGTLTATVTAGRALDLSVAAPGTTFTCTDAVAPGVPTLGLALAGAGGVAGYVTGAAATVPVTSGASDASGNFRGYQWVVGSTPLWTGATTVAATAATPVGLAVTGLALDVPNTVWVRAVDQAGNAGTPVSTTVVTDSVAPLQARINTPRPFVNDTTTSVTVAGGFDLNLDHYERCAFDQAATAACAACSCAATGGCTCGSAPAACSFAATDAAFALSIGAQAGKEKTCLYARAVDKAGRAGPLDARELVSDLVAPVGPVISPLYDPTAITIHADYADFFVTTPATDLPAGGGPWSNVAWVEVNAGSGFTPLCPAAACHPGGTYDPCGAACACTDPRLVCREGVFYAVRVPLLGGTANSVAVRSVDVAGNVGSGAAQEVAVAGLNFQVTATSYDEGQPRTRGRLLVFRGKPSVSAAQNSLRLVDLGANQLFDAGDTSCEISGAVGTAALVAKEPDAEPLGPTAVVFAEMPTISNQVRVRRAGLDGLFCTGDDTTTAVKTLAPGYPWVATLSASPSASGTRERAAWAEQPQLTPAAIVVRDGGADNLLGTADDLEWTAATATSMSVHQLQLAGDALLFGSNGNATSSACADLRVVTPVAGSWAAASARTWPLPAGALLAALDDGGRALAWFGHVGSTPTLRVVLPGADGLYGTADDVSRSMGWTGPTISDGGLAMRGGHVVLTEAAVSSGPGAIDHWYAGADGVFGTADDTFARILPSAAGRHHPALGAGLSGGTVYFESGDLFANADVLGVDLSALRWDVAGAGAPQAGPRTNHAGTLFYTDSIGKLRARTSAGVETTLTGLTPGQSYAADGALLFVGAGTQVWAFHQGATSGQFFAADSPAQTLVATLPSTAIVEAAGSNRVLASDNNTGNTFLYEPNAGATAWTQVPMEGVPVGYRSWFGGSAVSASQAVMGCIGPAATGNPAHVCVREAGVDGVFGTADDRLFTLTRPGALGNYLKLVAIASSGHRVALVADGVGGPHLYVLDAGADGKLGLGGDDVELDYGLIVDGRVGAISLAGNMLAWSTDIGTTNGQQVFLADVAQRTQRVLTTHFSPKPSVVVDPSGRAAWLDEVFPSSAIFISAP